MTVEFVNEAPKGVRYYPDIDDIASKMKPADIDEIAEIFQTPLTGSYNWDYKSVDGRIKKLYRLGKELNWNVDMDLDWTARWPREQYCSEQIYNPFNGYAPFEALSDDEKIKFDWHQLSNALSQFLHGEQGALLVSSQLVSCAPTFDAKLYAASQTFDEARHVEVFSKFIQKQIGVMYPVSDDLKSLLDKVLTDSRWDLKFIGMQIILEGLALAAFKSMRTTTKMPLLKEILRLVIRDEARHVTFGVNYLEEFVKSLSDQERQDRAQFAYEACVVMRDRLVGDEIYQEFGWDVDEARQYMMQSRSRADFSGLLFSRILPNLKRIGLLTEAIKPKFESLGLLQFEDFDDDKEIDWARLTRPLFENSEMPRPAVADAQ